MLIIAILLVLQTTHVMLSTVELHQSAAISIHPHITQIFLTLPDLFSLK